MYSVLDYCTPRFCYTIGLTGKIGFELIFAGGYFYSKSDVTEIVNCYASDLTNSAAHLEDVHGNFSLGDVCDVWVQATMLGAVDFYKTSDTPRVKAKQIVPQGDCLTLDVPLMNLAPGHARNSAWKWDFHDWPYTFPIDSLAATDLDFLRGAPAIQIVRWEEKWWECFSRDPDSISEDEFRKVPLGVVLALDTNLPDISGLELEDGFIKDEENKWVIWD